MLPGVAKPKTSGPQRARAKGGRVTPKTSGRYTPPVPRETKVSPMWVPIVMFACLGLGMVILVANYLNVLPGGEANNWYLLVGLFFITAGFVTATRYR